VRVEVPLTTYVLQWLIHAPPALKTLRFTHEVSFLMILPVNKPEVVFPVKYELNVQVLFV
jgi:hypothetical protein